LTVARKITVDVSETVYGALARDARDIGRGTKPEQIAEDWLEQCVREKRVMADKFYQAGKIVDRRLAANAALPDGDGGDHG
jgi:hypothetical protein